MFGPEFRRSENPTVSNRIGRLLPVAKGSNWKQALDVAVAQPGYIRTWVMVMPRSLNPTQGQLAKTNTLTDYQNLKV